MDISELNIRKIDVVRYITPLREGGSLPAIVEGSDGLNYVLKFRGAGQGTKALIADLIGAELARVAGFKVPFLAFAQLDEGLLNRHPAIRFLKQEDHPFHILKGRRLWYQTYNKHPD